MSCLPCVTVFDLVKISILHKSSRNNKHSLLSQSAASFFTASFVNRRKRNIYILQFQETYLREFNASLCFSRAKIRDSRPSREECVENQVSTTFAVHIKRPTVINSTTITRIETALMSSPPHQRTRRSCAACQL